MKHFKSMLRAGFLGFISYCSYQVHAQDAPRKPLDTRANILFGLTQPLIAKGFNIEGNWFYRRLSFDYSHGVSLDFSGPTVTGAVKEQHLAVHIPYSTGFGIGYRFTEWFNLRLEPKWHQFEIYYDGETQNVGNRIGKYNTFSLGIGAYANWQPFKNKDNALKGIMIAPSIRFWPKLASNLDGDSFAYQNKMTGKQEVHKAMEIGMNNTPLIVNISIGYSFKLK